MLKRRTYYDTFHDGFVRLSMQGTEGPVGPPGPPGRTGSPGKLVRHHGYVLLDQNCLGYTSVVYVRLSQKVACSHDCVNYQTVCYSASIHLSSLSLSPSS